MKFAKATISKTLSKPQTLEGLCQNQELSGTHLYLKNIVLNLKEFFYGAILQ